MKAVLIITGRKGEWYDDKIGELYSLEGKDEDGYFVKITPQSVNYVAFDNVIVVDIPNDLSIEIINSMASKYANMDMKEFLNEELKTLVTMERKRSYVSGICKFKY